MPDDDDRHPGRHSAQPTETTLKLIRRAIDLELRTEPGRVNALVIVAAAVILSLAGSRNLLEQLISIWSDDYVANFPIIPVTALLIGGGLICVGLLIVAEPLLPKRPPRGRRDP